MPPSAGGAPSPAAGHRGPWKCRSACLGPTGIKWFMDQLRIRWAW